MSDNPIKTQIQGHSSGNTEVWDVKLTHADGRIAFVNGLAECKDARQAEEFLRLGFATGWEIKPVGELAMMPAGLAALRHERENPPEDEFGDERIVGAIWCAMIDEWTRLMLARIERGEEPDESK